MMELISVLTGFGSALLPYVFKYIQDRADKAHERYMGELSYRHSKYATDSKLSEIEMGLGATQAVIIQENKFKGSRFTNAANAAVPAVYAYTFLTMWVFIQLIYVYMFRDAAPIIFWENVWTDADQFIFNTIVTHYLGDYTIKKTMGY